MIKQSFYLLVGYLSLIHTTSYAQAPTTLPLAKAWELAFENYPGLKEKKAQISLSEYQQRLVKHQALPQAQLQLQNTYGTYAGSSGAFFPLPGIFNVNSGNTLPGEPEATTNAYGSLVLDWKLFEFGKQRKSVAAAAQLTATAQSNFTAYQLAVQSKVTRQYFDILFYQSLLSLTGDNLARIKDILELSKSLGEAGLKPMADTLLAAASYKQVQGEQSLQTGQLQAGKIQLMEMLTVPTAHFNIPAAAYLNIPAAITGNDTSIQPHHPYLDVIDQQLQYELLQQEIVSRKIFPSLSLLGGVASRGSGIHTNGKVNNSWQAGFDNRANNYLAGLGLTWNMTNAYNSLTEKKKAAQQVQATRFHQQTQALQLHTNLLAVYSRIREQWQQVQFTTAAVQQAQQGYELYLARYESGLISLTELLQIQALLQQAEKNHIDASRQWWEQQIIKAELTTDFTYLLQQFEN
ncbi:TolC family protein [Chitinophaga defluvii]|uniref:TolC family protein n=1 Tax=Chitinophaga defluvii TaxID=3163343 RepID=A0ABV2T2E5_9BACT